MKFIFLQFTLVVFIVFILSPGCKESIEKEPDKIVCVLFDMSETTNSPEIRKTYLNKFEMILDKMDHGDAIEAALITEKSVSELNLSIEHSFPEFKPTTDNEMMLKAERKNADELLKAQKDSLLNVADSVLFDPPRKILGTEILSSLQVAERVLAAFPQQKKILVIFSDMIEESSIANFAREDLSEKQIERIISRQKQNGTLPSLKNVKVYVAGATHPDTEKYNRIKNFWFNYFNETGAKLEQHNYGAALIRFEE